MGLITCADCGKSVSDKAPTCPGCGCPIAGGLEPSAQKKIKIDKRGVWCPNCGNRDSVKKTSGAGCLLLGILLISMIGILFIPFLPKEWKCNVCGHLWKA